MKNTPRDIKVTMDNCSIWLKDRGLVHVTFNEGVEVSERDALKIMGTIRKLSDLDSRSIVVDLRQIEKIDLRSRSLLSRGKANKTTAAGVAIIVKNKVKKHLGNLLFNIDRQGMPVKMFLNEEQAFNWTNRVGA